MLSVATDKLLAIFEDIVIWMFEQFIKPFADLRGLKHLIFGKDDEYRTVWGTFGANDLTNALGPTYYTVLSLAGIFLVGFIAIHGMSFASSRINPTKRSDLIQFLFDLGIVVFLLFNLPLFYDLLFQLNMAIVGLFSSAYDAGILDRWSNIGGDIMGSPDNPDDPAGTPPPGVLNAALGILGVIFIQLVLLGLSLWANFYYFMRKVTLIILMALGPLMIVFWLHPKFKGITGAWSKELIGSIFVQGVHAFVFWTIATLSSTESGLVEGVLLYIIFIPIGEKVRGLLNMGGDMQGGLSKAGAMMGMAALGGMYGSVKGALGDKSVAGALKGAYDGIKDKKGTSGNAGSTESGGDVLKTVGAEAGGDGGTTSRAERMLRAGDVVSRMGKAVVGSAGSLAGSALGPVGAMVGASVGFEAGGVAGGVTGRVGAATVQGLVSRGKKGLAAVNALKEKQAGTFDDSVANEVADRDTAAWTDQHRASTMNNLRERFPDASEGELDAKFKAIQGEKRVGFYNAAKNDLKSVNASGVSAADGDSMVETSARAMSSQWAKDNQEAFYADYDKSNPKQEGESHKAYGARRQNAFKTKKGEMQQQFADAGHDYIASNVNEGGMVSTEGFNHHMNGAAGTIVGAAQAGNYKDLAGNSVAHVHATNLANGKGKPDVHLLANGLASAKTAQMEKAYIAEQTGNGVATETARLDWKNNHQAQAHAANLSTYNETVQQASNNHIVNPEMGTFAQRSGQRMAQAAAFVGGASGVTGAYQATTNGLNTIVGASRAGIATHMSMRDEDASGIQNLVTTAKPSLQAAWSEVGNQSMENQGVGPVEAQANYQRSVGYGAGVIMGAGGYRAAQRLATKITPYKQQVQSAIHSPGEVIQMAQTTTDNYGNVQLANGAVRQVVTANESYVEVMTKGGERKIVSRKGSGHSGMRKGDVVYQDLTMEGDALVASSPATYRLDSAGGRATSSIEINNNPSTLLGNARVGQRHQETSQKQFPVFNQAVDQGKFYTNDLASNGFSNVEVIVEKNRQFMTGQKDGVTYRVSPVYSGDSRLDSKQSVQVPVNVSSNKVTPTYHGPSTVAVEANVSSDGSSTTESIPYYSTKSVRGLIQEEMLDELMPSKHANRAHRSVDQRAALDVVRRKQGLLG